MMRWLILAVTGCFLASFVSSPVAAQTNKSINERLLLIHAVPSQKGGESEKAAVESVFDGLAEQLTDKGYRVIDKASSEECSMEIAAIHDIDPQINKAASFGLKFFAEYTIFFRTSIITKDNDTGKGALVKVSAKVVDNTSSQIITSKSSDASSSGLTLNDAIAKAGRTAGKKLAANLSGALEKFYRESSKNGRTYTVVVETPVAGRDLFQLLSQLERNSAVSAAKETESGGGKSTFEICYNGKRDQLDRDLLKSATELGWQLQKVRSEGNRSTWKIK